MTTSRKTTLHGKEVTVITTSKVKAGKLPVMQGVLAYFPRALLAIAQVSQYGAVKHDAPLSEKGFLRPEYTPDMYLDGKQQGLSPVEREEMTCLNIWKAIMIGT